MSRLDEPPVTDLVQRLAAVELDDVAVRRLRQSVLAQAAADVQTSGVRRAHRPWGLDVRVVVAVSVLGAVWSPRHELGTEAFAVSVRSADGRAARWSRHLDARTERVDLLDGAFRVEVRGGVAHRYVIIGVPDGRIEDLGTIFEVRVEAGRTRRVHVEEGRVAVWVGGASELLAAGQTWEPSAAPVERPAAPAAAPSSSSSAPRLRTRPAMPLRPASGAAPEDTAYLELLHLLRTARPADAREAARDYLRRFPDAFRREEVERLAK